MRRDFLWPRSLSLFPDASADTELAMPYGVRSMPA